MPQRPHLCPLNGAAEVPTATTTCQLLLVTGQLLCSGTICQAVIFSFAPTNASAACCHLRTPPSPKKVFTHERTIVAGWHTALYCNGLRHLRGPGNGQRDIPRGGVRG